MPTTKELDLRLKQLRRDHLDLMGDTANFKMNVNSSLKNLSDMYNANCKGLDQLEERVKLMDKTLTDLWSAHNYLANMVTGKGPVGPHDHCSTCRSCRFFDIKGEMHYCCVDPVILDRRGDRPACSRYEK